MKNTKIFPNKLHLLNQLFNVIYFNRLMRAMFQISWGKDAKSLNALP